MEPPRKSRLCRGMRCSTAVSFSLSCWQGPASRRASGQQIEQLVNSEQTAALQESPSMFSQPGSSTPTNTQGEIWPAVPPLSLLPFGAFVSPGWLLGLDLMKRAIKGQIAWSAGCKFNPHYSHFSSVKKKKSVLCLPLKRMYQVLSKD